jgi:plastocyanin
MHRLAGVLGRTAAVRLGAALALAIGLGTARVPAGAAADPAPPIRIENFHFEPAELVVQRGSTVTWVNRDEELHAIVAVGGAFSSPGLDTDASYTHAFDAPGIYEYRCALHPQMRGTIVVR